MNIAKLIDHTMLKPEATSDIIKQYCNEAKEYGFASVCVNTYYASLVANELQGTGINTCCVVGFPLGAVSASVKAFETARAIEVGADEIDMVINIGALKEKKDEVVVEDIKQVVNAADSKTVKVIIETCLLTEEEKVRACKLAMEAGAHFVKTSTGFSTGGATIEDIKLMKKTVGDKMKIKASGGIRTPEFAKELIEAGADRIGAGDGKKLI